MELLRVTLLLLVEKLYNTLLGIDSSLISSHNPAKSWWDFLLTMVENANQADNFKQTIWT